jgi:hypothetical protein
MSRTDSHVEHGNFILALLHHDVMAGSVPGEPV